MNVRNVLNVICTLVFNLKNQFGLICLHLIDVGVIDVGVIDVVL